MAVLGFMGTAFIVTLFAIIIIFAGFWATQQYNRLVGGGGG